MRALRLSSLLLLSCFVLFGELDSNTITIRSSRFVTVPPDQVVFNVTVNAPQTAGLDDVLAALRGSGVTAADLTNISSEREVIEAGAPFVPTLIWMFSTPAPFAKVGARLGALKTLQQTLSSGWGLTYNAYGLQTSAESVASQQCSIPDLLADARRQAATLANAAGLTAGAILALSDGTAVRGDAGWYPTSYFASFPSIRFGTFSAYVSPFVDCSLVAKFQLLRYQ